jgi:hypothetical protein
MSRCPSFVEHDSDLNDSEESAMVLDAMLERFGEPEESMEQTREVTRAYEFMRSYGGPW